jgi:hypothetical protein
MSKPLLGALVGAVLGILDGLSAWFSPEARPIFVSIAIGSTLKGLVTGLLAGLVARWRRSTLLGIVAGLLIGFALSSVVALSQPGHYMEIVLPGMLVGTLVGFVTQRYPTVQGRRGSGAAVSLLAILWVLSASHVPASAQQSPPPDPLKSVAWVIGKWSGTSEGQPGKGTVERQYDRVLGGRFIKAKNRVAYPATEKAPKGELHEDEGWYSFDRSRKRVVLRQFHVEGFVNQYVEEPAGLEGSVVFTSEAIENIPAGFRARETYIVRGPDEFEEIFELAEPGQPFKVYSRAILKRTK